LNTLRCLPAGSDCLGGYLYRTLRVAYGEAASRVIGHVNSFIDGDMGMPAPATLTDLTSAASNLEADPF
jgi:hypothetical protein